MPKKNTAKQSPASIVSTLVKVKLPDLAYHLDHGGRGRSQYRITKLTNLRFDPDAADGACGCTNLIGDDVVKDGRTSYTNQHDVAAKNCYPTLAAAIEAKSLSILRSKKLTFLESHRRNSTQSDYIRLFKNHPDFVLSVLLENFEVDVPFSVDDLKITHYRLASTNYRGKVMQLIVNKNFPELVDDDNHVSDD